MSIFVQKIRGKFDLSVIGNLKSEGEPYRCWMFADDLVLGEEVIIERKEIKQSSDPLSFPDSGKIPVPNEKEELQWKLRRFHTLEELLSEEGLI
ncbi:MAG: hypothetical protein LBG15_11400 [Dysgonamonadaceae bacterium]|nr:hypothetical protein [Dysgonamonadaceae bacterium]